MEMLCYLATVHVCVLSHIMQPGEGTWTCAWDALACAQKEKKHACRLRQTMRSIVVRNVGDNGEGTGRVGSWKVRRRSERGENIQFNFQTVPAQSTNTKASLQADPC